MREQFDKFTCEQCGSTELVPAHKHARWLELVIPAPTHECLTFCLGGCLEEWVAENANRLRACDIVIGRG